MADQKQILTIKDVLDFCWCPRYYDLKKNDPNHNNLKDLYDDALHKCFYEYLLALQNNTLANRLETLKYRWGKEWIKQKKNSQILCTPSATKRDTYDAKRRAGIDAIITFDKLMDTPQYPILINKQYSLPITDNITLIGTWEYIREVEIDNNKTFQLLKFKTENNIVIVDPVMGDYGKLYCTYTDKMCEKMQHLIKYADCLTPNLTELCRLLNIPYPKETPSPEKLNELCKELSKEGPSKIVITGLKRDGDIENFIFEKGKEFKTIRVKKIGEDRSGTGDVFSSIVSASLVKGEDFAYCVEKAVNFISKSLTFTNELNLPTTHGVCFEEFLTELK